MLRIIVDNVHYPHWLGSDGQEVKDPVAEMSAAIKCREFGDMYGWFNGIKGRAVVYE